MAKYKIPCAARQKEEQDLFLRTIEPTGNPARNRRLLLFF